MAWRDHCKPIIEAVLSQKLPEDEERKALLKAYPYGERKRWPYKVWLDEIKRQKGLKPSIVSKQEIVDPSQLDMFNNGD